MTFLNTTILFGLVAAAIPIIIHFLTKQKAKTIDFSSLRFLKELEFQQIKRLRIKQILLLILRTLIILLLILAFARPTLKGTNFSGIGSTAKTSAVIILDNSFSMSIKSGGQQAYDVLKKAALTITDLFETGDELYGLYATERTPKIFDGARYRVQTVQTSIRQSDVSQSRADILSALIEAKRILSNSGNINKEIYLISDLQQTAFSDLDESLLPLIKNEEIKLFIIPVQHKNVNNQAVIDVRLRNQILEKDKVVEVEAAIKNVGNKPMRDGLAQLFMDEKRAGQAAINLNPDETKLAQFRVVPHRTGFISGSVFVGDDDLFDDNRRYFTFFIPDVVRVLLISEQEKACRFVQLALNPGRNRTSQVNTEQISPAQVNGENIRDYQVIILCNVPKVEGVLLSSLNKHVEDGGGLIVFPGSNVDLRHYNENLNQKLSLPFFTETIGEYGSKKFSVSLGQIDFDHPLFSGVFEKNKKQVDSPQFYFYTKIAAQPEDDVIMEFSDGEPFLLEHSFKTGKVLLFTSTIDPDWSDMYLKGLFVPLINRCVAYATNTPSQEDQRYFVDDEINTQISAETNYIDFSVKSPEGKMTQVVPTLTGTNLNIKFDKTQRPGIYKLFHRDKLIKEWAINVDPAESNFSFIDENKLKSVVGNAKKISYTNNNELIEQIVTTRYGRELWKYFVGIIVILLIMEMILGRQGRKAEAQIKKESFETV